MAVTLLRGGYETKRGFNFRFIAKVLGVLALLQVLLLLMAQAFSYYYHDGAHRVLWLTALIDFLVGGALVLYGQKHHQYDTGRREGMVAVTVSWFFIALLGMLPYLLGGYISNLSNAFFETISGLTTTGATILTDIESLPESILFWRSMTQWMGGIGIVVFLVALVPITGESASIVYDHEVTGVTHDKFLPRITDMAKWTALIYVILTLLCTLLLWAGPFSFFSAVCHALTCISTGGFSIYNDSISGVGSPYVIGVLSFFMFVGAVSFTLLYHALVKRDPMKMLRDGEFRWFVGLVAILTLVSALYLSVTQQSGQGLFVTFAQSLFQIISLMTTTGYAIADYNLWGSTFWVLALFAMFVAGCSGSTSGGLKVIRFNILTRSLINEFKKRTHPHAVIPLRINGYVLQEKFVAQVFNFFFAYLVLMVVGTFSVSLEGYGLADSISATIACVSNSGPGLGAFGPLESFTSLSAFNKIFLGILMVVGRLEIFTVLTILHRSFWKN